MRLTLYLNEWYDKPRSMVLYQDDVLELLKNDCSEALASKNKIYRGTNSNDFYRITDPSEGIERISAYAVNNYYTLLMNNLPSWSEYPKRSIICTTDSNKAQYYKVLFRVFPVNGAKLGVCSGSDIWDSLKSMSSANLFNNDLFEILIELGGYPGAGDYDDLETKLKSMDREILKKESKIKKLRYNEVIDIFKRKPKYKNLFDLINLELLNPQKNKFKIMNISQKLPDYREVWTDSRCIMVRLDKWPGLSNWIKA